MTLPVPTAAATGLVCTDKFRTKTVESIDHQMLSKPLTKQAGQPQKPLLKLTTPQCDRLQESFIHSDSQTDHLSVDTIS